LIKIIEAAIETSKTAIPDLEPESGILIKIGIIRIRNKGRLFLKNKKS